MARSTVVIALEKLENKRNQTKANEGIRKRQLADIMRVVTTMPIYIGSLEIS
jgi:hypothetical protein